MKCLHYVFTMSVFQADTLAFTLGQFRKFIYQTLYDTKNLCKLHKQKPGKCNFVHHLTMRRQKDYEAIRINCHAYQATTKYTNFSNNEQK